jgi:hypothetical protein
MVCSTPSISACLRDSCSGYGTACHGAATSIASTVGADEEDAAPSDAAAATRGGRGCSPPPPPPSANSRDRFSAWSAWDLARCAEMALTAKIFPLAAMVGILASAAAMSAAEEKRTKAWKSPCDFSTALCATPASTSIRRSCLAFRNVPAFGMHSSCTGDAIGDGMGGGLTTRAPRRWVWGPLRRAVPEQACACARTRRRALAEKGAPSENLVLAAQSREEKRAAALPAREFLDYTWTRR